METYIYAVFGRGWGNDHLCGDPKRTGNLWWSGEGRERAEQELKKARRNWEGMKKENPGLRSSTFNHCIYRWTENTKPEAIQP